MPALLVVGAHDQPLMHVTVRELAAGMPRARAVVVDGAAHLVNAERPERFAALLAAFLDEVAAEVAVDDGDLGQG